MTYGPMEIAHQLGAGMLEAGFTEAEAWAMLKPYLVPEFEEEQI